MMMTFENQDIRVIVPMDPDEGRWYIELVKYEVVRGWDHAYNIYEYHIHPTTNREIGCHNASSVTSDSEDVLENWQNRMH